MTLLTPSVESQWIEFPNLDWKFDISESFSLFGLEIKFYGLLIAIGFSLAVLYGLKRAKYFNINPDGMIDLALIVTPLAFIGARLYYVFFSPNVDHYLADPVSILKVWEGGLGIYGGVLVAFLIGPFLCKWRKVHPLAMMDVASLGFLIGQGIGRWGNFFNQEAFGGNTNLPWAMTGNVIADVSTPNGTGYNPALPVHPTFLYESLWCLAGFVLLHILSKKCYKFKGQIFCGYAIWYGVGRFFIESLRTDSLTTGAFRTSQLVALAAIVGGTIMYIILFRLSRTKAFFMVHPPVAEEPAVEEPVTVTATTEPTETVAEEPAPEEENHGEDH